ncbi:hypothetical protein ACJEMY_25370, partial [Escherichia coli]
TVSTQTTLWVLASALIGWWLGRGIVSGRQGRWRPTIAIGVLSVAAGYVALAVIDRLYHTDFRLWIIAVKLPTARQAMIALIYVVPITIGLI